MVIRLHHQIRSFIQNTKHDHICVIGYQGSQSAMYSIRDADVVFALGARLSPFGILPQYGIDYWPKNAKIIQVICF